jgi:hypothetical protein
MNAGASSAHIAQWDSDWKRRPAIEDHTRTMATLCRIRYLANAFTWAQALLPYPRGFQRCAGDSGCVTPVSSHVLAVTVIGPGRTSTVKDHNRQAHWLITGCKSA